jgi:hypothetical protein
MFPVDSLFRLLELFASLGINSELATRIIATIDQQVGYQPAEPPERHHLIVFASHRVDEPERTQPAFRKNHEPRARELIAEALGEAGHGWARLSVMASAAPGSDILCHEVCRELGLEGTICLPMPRDVVATTVFGELYRWRARYLDLLSWHDANHRSVLELSDRDGLPRGLQGSRINPWERGNRWVLEMAHASGASKVTLIALWDGKPTGDTPTWSSWCERRRAKSISS